MSHALRRAGMLLAGTLLAYGLLVSAHAGEFWPFSIYPMFSQAGQPWSRTLVREVDVPPDRASALFETDYAPESLPGTAFPLRPNGIDNKDLSNFVSKTERWTPRRVRGLRSVFEPHLPDRTLLVMRVNGQMVEGDSVTVTAIPYVYLGADTTALHPEVAPSESLATASPFQP